MWSYVDVAWIVSGFLISELRDKCVNFRSNASHSGNVHRGFQSRIIRLPIKDADCGLQFNWPSTDLAPRPARKRQRPEKGCVFSLAFTCMRHSNSFLFCWNSILVSNHYRAEVPYAITVKTQYVGVLSFSCRSILDWLHTIFESCLSKFMGDMPLCKIVHGLDDLFLQKSTTLSFFISARWPFWFNLFSSCGGYL